MNRVSEEEVNRIVDEYIVDLKFLVWVSDNHPELFREYKEWKDKENIVLSTLED